MVDDPNANEISKRVVWQMEKKRNMDPAEVLGLAVTGQEQLLRLMFPRFGANRTDESGSRISRRQNLVRALYLGDPPGIASSAEIAKLWAQSDEATLCTTLRQMLKAGELRPIIDRLDDLLPKLPEEGDAKFWRALAKALIRESDWLLDPEDNHAIAEEAATYLLSLGFRDKTKVERVKRIVEALLAACDLVILPKVLRQHLFRWGLTVHAPSERGGDYVFTKKETEELLLRSVPTFQAALLDGTLLQRIPNCEAIFALSNTGNWDDSLRKSLTAQLESYNGRASVAGLIVPPGYTADRSSIDQLFDADAVLAWMRAAKEGVAPDSWRDQNLRRLRAILAGKDSMFAFDDDDDGAEARA